MKLRTKCDLIIEIIERGEMLISSLKKHKRRKVLGKFTYVVTDRRYENWITKKMGDELNEIVMLLICGRGDSLAALRMIREGVSIEEDECLGYCAGTVAALFGHFDLALRIAKIRLDSDGKIPNSGMNILHHAARTNLSSRCNDYEKGGRNGGAQNVLRILSSMIELSNELMVEKDLSGETALELSLSMGPTSAKNMAYLYAENISKMPGKEDFLNGSAFVSAIECNLTGTFLDFTSMGFRLDRRPSPIYFATATGEIKTVRAILKLADGSEDGRHITADQISEAVGLSENARIRGILRKHIR